MAKDRSSPYTVVIDSREQLPYLFADALGDGRGNRLAIQTTVSALDAGDYSISGFEREIAVERKSHADLFSTLGQSRDRFVRELNRLQEYKSAAVVCEADWVQIFADPPSRSQLNPKSILCSVIAWQQRFPAVHWWFVPGREMGEVVTLRILDRFWRERNT